MVSTSYPLLTRYALFFPPLNFPTTWLTPRPKNSAAYDPVAIYSHADVQRYVPNNSYGANLFYI